MAYDNLFYPKKFIKLNSIRQNILKKYNIHSIKCKSSYLIHKQKLHFRNDWNEGVKDIANELGF